MIQRGVGLCAKSMYSAEWIIKNGRRLRAVSHIPARLYHTARSHIVLFNKIFLEKDVYYRRGVAKYNFPEILTCVSPQGVHQYKFKKCTWKGNNGPTARDTASLWHYSKFTKKVGILIIYCPLEFICLSVFLSSCLFADYLYIFYFFFTSIWWMCVLLLFCWYLLTGYAAGTSIHYLLQMSISTTWSSAGSF